MRWIGLTGGIASGKSTATKVLRTLGYIVVDADQIAHEVTERGEPALQQIVSQFGLEMLNQDGSLNRRKLGERVFGREEDRKLLEAIVHPFVRAKVAAQKKELDQKGTVAAFYDVPLLFEKNLETEFDAVILVSCTEQQQLERLMQRNQLTSEQAQARLQSQLPLKEKEKKTPYVIHNTRDVNFLEQEIRRVLKDLSLAV